MNVLITGGAGYIGSVTSALLTAQSVEVTVLDRLLYGAEGLIALLPFSNFKLQVGEIRDRALVQQVLNKSDAVVHMAALVGDAACEIDTKATLEINYEATQQLGELCEEQGVSKLIYISTCSNYGATSHGSIASEETPTNPLSLYARTKIQAENSVLGLKGTSPAKCVLRLATVCGLSPRMRFDLLVNDLARRAVTGEEITMYQPQAWRPFLHIRDAANAILCALKAPQELINGKVFNVVGENWQKSRLEDLVRRRFPPIRLRARQGVQDARDYRVSADLIRSQLGFVPSHTI